MGRTLPVYTGGEQLMSGINIDAKELFKVSQALGTNLKKQVPGVINRVLNRSATAARTAASRAVRDNYHVTVKNARATMKISKGTQSRLGAFVLSKGQLVPLDKYKVKPGTVRPGRRTLRKVAVSKGKTPTAIKGAFMAEVSGAKLFERVGKKRLPISRLMGPAIPQLVDNDDVIEVVDKVVMETYAKRMDFEIGRALNKGARK